MRGLKSVQFRNPLVLCGDNINRECPLVNKRVRVPGHVPPKRETYVQVKTKDTWLTQAVMGTAFKGVLYPGVLTDLHDKVVAAETRLRSGFPVEGYDPMDEMEADAEPQPPRHTTKSKFKKQVSTIVMKEWPDKPTSLEREVAVYLEGSGKLWIKKEDLNWLIRTLYIQQQLKGVAIVASDDEGSDAVVTPEKRPKPQECEGHLHDKWDTPP